MSENKLIDTNILVYAFDRSEKKKHEKATSLLEVCLSHKEVLYISTQNISEFYHVVTRNIGKPLPKSEAIRICEKLIRFSGFKKIMPSPNTLFEAMKVDEKYKVGYWDALIAATMAENGINTILTENSKDFKKIPGLVVTNPFE